jgi:tetratricopeptide (TPR) repeat protein
MKKVFLLFLTIILMAYHPTASQGKAKELNAKMKSSLVEMDSLFKNYHLEGLYIEQVIERADEQCAKFRNNPEYMMGIADLFFTSMDNELLCKERYSEIKKLYPKNMEVYLREASLWFQYAWKYSPDCNVAYLQMAKEQVDSAKILFPNSAEPYMRWAYWQAPYRHVRLSGFEELSVDNELTALKEKFPDHPCYREIARYYLHDLSKRKDNLSKDDWANCIIYAAEFYGKENRQFLTDNDIVDYADACNTTNDPELLAKALDVLNYGIQRNSRYPSFYRYKMYAQSKLADSYRRSKEVEKAKQGWLDVKETGAVLFTKFKKKAILATDYYYLALANKELKLYDQAVSYYNKQLEIEKDTTQRLSALFDIVNCYNKLEQYDNAISVFSEYESLRRAAGKPIEYYYYNSAISAYIYMAIDTLVDKEKRISCFEKADSLLMLSSEASPEYLTQINQRRLEQVTLPLLPLVHGASLENKLFAYPEVLEAAQRLEASVLSVTEMQDLEYYRLMEAYYYSAVHYLMNDNYEQVYEISEKMLSKEMPASVELQSLSNARKVSYDKWTDFALKVNKMFKPKKEEDDLPETTTVTEPEIKEDTETTSDEAGY